MASLTGQSIASSYEQLLQVDRDGGGNGSTLVDIKDGDNGTTFALQIATDKIQVNGNATITTTDNTDTLTLTSTDDGASSAPNLRLYRNSPSPADSDVFGQIDFDGRNLNSEDFVGARIKVASGDVADGSEDAQIEFDVMTGGTLREYMRMASGSTPAVIFNQDSRDIDFRVLSDNLDPAFFVQGSDGNVGIGLSDPNSILMVGGSTSSGGDIAIANTNTTISDGDSLGGIYFKGKDDGSSGAYGIGAKIVADCTQDWNEGTAEGTELKFWVTNNNQFNNINAMTIGQSGETYIGSDAQGISFHGVNSGEGNITAINRNVSGYKKLVLNATDHSFKISGTEKVVINSSGHVSINDTSTAKQLNVLDTDSAAARFTRSTASATTGHLSDALVVRGKSGGYMADGFGAMIAFELNDSANSDNGIGGCGMMRDGADNSGKFFITNNNAGTYATNFYVDKTGSIGIGESSPANVIHLKSATPVMRWEHTTNGILGYLGDTTNFLTNPDSAGADSFGWRSEGDIRLGTGGNNLALIIDSSQDSKFYGKVEVNGYGLTLVRSAPVIEFNDTDESGSGDGGGKFKIASDNDRLGFFGRADNDSTWNERVYLTRAGDILPATDDAHDLGSSSNRFDDVYATNGTIQTSDERLKDNITDSSLGLDFLNALRPVEYQWKDYSYDIEKEESVEAQDAVYETVVVQKAVDAKDAVMGTRQKTISKEVEKTRTEIVEEDGKYVQKETSYTEAVEELQYEEVDLYNKDGEVIGSHTIPIMEEYEVEPAIKAKDAVMETKEKTFARTHFGLIAQEVEQVLKDSSLTNNDFAGLIYDEDADRYGMRYHELIAPLIKAVQELSKKVTDLENK